jgi:hypothetical protein
MDLGSWKEKIKKSAELDIEFDSHFFLRVSQRDFSIAEVQGLLNNPGNLEEVDEYKKEGYRLVFRISSKFQLVIGVQFLEKGLYVKNYWFLSMLGNRWLPQLNQRMYTKAISDISRRHLGGIENGS